MGSSSWYKEFDNECDKLCFRGAFAAHAYSSICAFFLIKQLICQREDRDKDPGYAIVHFRILASRLGTNERGLVTILRKVQEHFGDEVLIYWPKINSKDPSDIPPSITVNRRPSPDDCQFFMPNWKARIPSRKTARKAGRGS